MKVTCISDTHGYHNKVVIEPTELLLFAGDAMTSGYNVNQIIDFLKWFDSQPAKYKVMVAGNHCRWIENNPEEFRKLMENYPDITYLEDEWVEIEGYKIYGTPHSKIFYYWAFNRTEEELAELFDKIPKDIDVLVSHAPAYDTLDYLMDGDKVGEKTLQRKLSELYRLKLHVFGHIHNAFGMIKPHNKHISVNAAQVDEAYDCVNFPVIVKI